MLHTIEKLQPICFPVIVSRATKQLWFFKIGFLFIILNYVYVCAVMNT